MSRGRCLLVGVDVGTTLTKAGVVDLEGNEINEAAVPTTWQREPTGGSARPGDLFAAAAAAVSDVLGKTPAGEVVGVGVTSMAETVILVDAAGAGIGPSVAWHDLRAAQDFAELKSEFGDRFGQVTGLGTSQIPSIATMRWLMRNITDAHRAVSVSSVAEWVVSCLGGARAAEASLASRTGALSVATRQWWNDALDWAGAPRTIFPEVLPAGALFGHAHDVPPGLERIDGAALTVAGHDHLCAALGLGASHGDQVMDDCGTAEALVRALPVERASSLAAGLSFDIAVGWHVFPGHYALLAGYPFGLELAAVLDGLGVKSRHGLTELDAPALALRGPWASAPLEPWGAAQPAALSNKERPAAAAQAWWTAVSSAVTRSRRTLDGFEELGGPAAEVVMSGGWARNPLLMRLKSEVFPPLSYPLVRQAGTRGAALLAGLAAGVHRDVSELPSPRFER
jgi:sugar (pentulose or hexulose) kinase